MRNSSTNPGGASGLSTLSKIGFTSRIRNAAIAPTIAISTTDASEYSTYGRTYISNRQMRFNPPLSKSSSRWASLYSIVAALTRHVPMRRLHPIARRRQPLLHLFGNEYRPMLPARTSKRHRQIALALLDVVRQQKLQHIHRLIQKLRR